MNASLASFVCRCRGKQSKPILTAYPHAVENAYHATVVQAVDS